MSLSGIGYIPPVEKVSKVSTDMRLQSGRPKSEENEKDNYDFNSALVKALMDNGVANPYATIYSGPRKTTKVHKPKLNGREI